VDNVGIDYLRRAGECERLAEAASDAEEREQLLQMAQKWRDLAERRRQPYGGS